MGMGQKAWHPVGLGFGRVPLNFKDYSIILPPTNFPPEKGNILGVTIRKTQIIKTLFFLSFFLNRVFFFFFWREKEGRQQAQMRQCQIEKSDTVIGERKWVSLSLPLLSSVKNKTESNQIVKKKKKRKKMKKKQ